jgi:hypothetical protein
MVVKIRAAEISYEKREKRQVENEYKEVNEK